MSGAELPTTIVGLIGLAIVTLGGIVHLRVQQKVTVGKINATAEQIDEVHEQVRNDHPRQPNLRHDLDEIRSIVRDIQDRTIVQERDVTGMRLDVSGLRHDLLVEVERSTAFDNRLLDELSEERERSIIADAELRGRIESCPNQPPELEQ